MKKIVSFLGILLVVSLMISTVYSSIVSYKDYYGKVTYKDNGDVSIVFGFQPNIPISVTLKDSGISETLSTNASCRFKVEDLLFYKKVTLVQVNGREISNNVIRYQ